jgi:threonine synthase
MALRASDGVAVSISDADALIAQRHLAAIEGLYGEPSTGTGLAGVAKLVAQGTIAPTDRVVVLACGGGFRETHALDGIVSVDRHPLHAARLLEYLGIG